MDFYPYHKLIAEVLNSRFNHPVFSDEILQAIEYNDERKFEVLTYPSFILSKLNIDKIDILKTQPVSILNNRITIETDPFESDMLFIGMAMYFDKNNVFYVSKIRDYTPNFNLLKLACPSELFIKYSDLDKVIFQNFGGLFKITPGDEFSPKTVPKSVLANFSAPYVLKKGKNLEFSLQLPDFYEKHLIDFSHNILLTGFSIAPK